MNNLNEIELKVLTACKDNIIENTGNEFGFGDEIEIENLSKNQVKGYLGQLVLKGYIYIDEEGSQLLLNKKCKEIFGEKVEYFSFADVWPE